MIKRYVVDEHSFFSDISILLEQSIPPNHQKVLIDFLLHITTI